MSYPVSDTIPIEIHVKKILQALGADPDYVASILIEPDGVTLTVFEGAEGRYKGAKLAEIREIDGKTEIVPVEEVLHFRTIQDVERING